MKIRAILRREVTRKVRIQESWRGGYCIIS